MLALLAPVPLTHLDGAVEQCARIGNIAFGSGWVSQESSGAWSFEFFSQSTLEERVGDLPVLIYLSHNPAEVGPRRFAYRGIYNGFAPALANGKHSVPEERPQSALSGDTPGGIFWRVKLLEAVPRTDDSFLKNLKTSRSGKPHLPVTHIPRKPELVFAA